MIKSVVFLGNAGPKYRNTRHNAGFMLCDHLEEQQLFSGEWKEKFNALNLQVILPPMGKILLCKPQKLMNNSGEVIQRMCSFYRLRPEELLVVYDDLETPFGTVACRSGGGHGGHNGIRSTIQALGSPEFSRLKIGIGRPQRQAVSSYVLSGFSPDERIALERILQLASEMLLSALAEKGTQNEAVKKSIPL